MLAECGRLAERAASLIMKLMYDVRMAGSHLAVVVGRLSSQIMKWTKDSDSDRRIHSAANLTIKGSPSTKDYVRHLRVGGMA